MLCIFIGSGLLAGIGGLHPAIVASLWTALIRLLGIILIVPLMAYLLAKNRNPKFQHYLFCMSLLAIMLGSAVFTSTMENIVESNRVSLHVGSWNAGGVCDERKR